MSWNLRGGPPQLRRCFAILGAFIGVFMDPNEIIKLVPEIAKGAAALGAVIPFTGIVKRMLGPAADELAEMWRDQVRLYRYERQLKCVEKAERMAQEAGFTPQAVPPKILFPLLEGASFEQNEDLHDMWASLLANASHAENAIIVRPAFIAILRQMSPDEAALLNWMSDEAYSHPYSFDREALMRGYIALGFGPIGHPDNATRQLDKSASFADRFSGCRSGLLAAQLIAAEDPVDPHRHYGVTSRGRLFIKVCRPPKAKE